MSGIHSRPPPHINVGNFDPNRDSRFESAQEADDIFALYGRDSWAMSDTASLREPHVAAASHSDVGTPRLGPNTANGDRMEQLDSDDEAANATPPRPSFETATSRPDFSQPRPGLDTPDSPRANAFYHGDSLLHAQPYHPGAGWSNAAGAEPEHTDRHVPATGQVPQQYVKPPAENPQAVPPESVNSHYSSSMAPHEPSSMDHHYSPYSGAGAQAHSDQYHSAHSGEQHDHYPPGPPGPPGPATPPRASSGSQSQPQSQRISRIPPPSLPPHLRTPERLSPPAAAVGSAPIHPSIVRLNGRAPRNGPPASPSSAGDHSMSLSQASLVSSQYPGEDDEAFHVRSTCEFHCFHLRHRADSQMLA